LAQSASGYRENQEAFAVEVCAFGSNLAEDDWRKEIIDYLENPSQKVSRKLRYKAINICSSGWTFVLQIIRWGVAATRHWFLELRWWWKKQAWIGKGLKAKGLVKSWGHIRFYL
jgi:hypothetical protein